MRSEPSSPGTVEAPRMNAAERGLRVVKQERAEKEGQVLRTALRKRANGILKDLKLPLKLEEERGELELGIEVKRPFSLKEYEGFDLNELMGDPNFRTETRRVGSLEYVVTKRISDKNGRESETVRPNGHGTYPEQEDLLAARMHDFFSTQPALHQEHIPPEDAALIAHNPAERAMEILLAVYPDMKSEQAAKWAGTVIKDLIAAHRKRTESL